MNNSGLTLPLMIGLRKWLVWELLPRNSLISQKTTLLVSVLHTSVSVETTNSPWWKNKLSFTIPQSPLLFQTLHYGHIPCTSTCHTNATVTCKTAQPVPTPSGKWSWTNWIVEKTQKTENTCQVVLWLILAQILWMVINSTLSWTTTSIVITWRTVLHWDCTSTLLGWRITPTSWKLSCTGSMKSWRNTMTFILSQWPKLSNGCNIQRHWTKSRTSNHGGRSVPLKENQPVGYQTHADWPPRKFPEKPSISKPAEDAPTTTHGSKTQPVTVSSKLSPASVVSTFFSNY